MVEIFNSAKRPFYVSTAFITLNRIPKEEYSAFIMDTFHKIGMSMDEKVPEKILELTCGHTYYTQRLCHEICANQLTFIREKDVTDTLYGLIQQNEAVYFQYRNLLTTSQWKTLKAVASEEVVYKPYSQNFIKNYDLGSTSTLKRNLEALVYKAIIYHNLSVDEPYYEVEDKFLMRWLKNQ